MIRFVREDLGRAFLEEKGLAGTRTWKEGNKPRPELIGP